MTTQIKKIYEVFYDKNNDLLESGYIYIGTANQNPITNPIQTYFDDGLTIPALQPLRTVRGAISNNGTPANIYVSEADYSIAVQDKNKILLYSAIDKAKEFVTIDSITNVTNLRLYEPTTDGQIINLLGFTTAGYGGGTFRYDASDTTTADNNDNIIVTSLGRRWKKTIDNIRSSYLRTINTGGTITASISDTGIFTGVSLATTGAITATGSITGSALVSTGSITSAFGQVASTWVSFIGATPTIINSYNVTSITKGGVGSYTINFTTALPNNTYFCTLSYNIDNGTTRGEVQTNTKTTTSINIVSTRWTGASWVVADPLYIDLGIFCKQ